VKYARLGDALERAWAVFSVAGLVGCIVLSAPNSLTGGCSPDPEPGPVAAPESAASSSSSCPGATFACCAVVSVEPTCKDGALSCEPGFETCAVGAGGD